MNAATALLVHRVNNLLAVVFTQVEAARLDGGQDAKDRALAHIEQAAKAVDAELRRFRAGDRDGPPPG
jgi:hypothetical protein